MSAPPPARLLRALRFAAEQHRDDRRKGPIGAPYINHPITVAEQLAVAGVDNDDVLVAAVLHDVIEDTDATAADLRERFGERVARIVGEVSDDKTLSREERRRRTVAHIGEKSREARLVKLSDLLANVCDLVHQPPDWVPERKQAYLRWAADVMAAMGPVHPSLEARVREALRTARRAVVSG